MTYFDQLQHSLEVLLDQGNYQEVIQQGNYALDSMEYFPELLDRQAQIWAFMGSAQRNLGHFDQSLVSFQKATQYRSQHCGSQSEEVASGLLNIGNLHLETNQLLLAKLYFNQSKQIYTRLAPENQSKLPALYNSIGHLALLQDEFSEAEILFQKAIELAKSNFRARRDLASYATSLAEYYQRLGNEKKAQVVLLRTLSEIKDIPTPHFTASARVHQQLGIVYSKTHQFKLAILHLDSAIWNFEQLPVLPVPEYGNCLQNKGIVLLNNGDVELSELYFASASSYLSDFPLDLGACLQNLGLAYLYQNEYELAENAFIESIEAYRSVEDDFYSEHLSSVHLNLGTCYMQQPIPALDIAEYYIQESIKGFKRPAPSAPYLKGLNKLGQCFIQQQRYREAASILNKASSLAKSNFPLIYCTNLYYQSILLRHQEKPQEAIAQLTELLNLLPTPYLHFRTQIFTQLAALHQELGDWEKSLAYAEFGIEILNGLKNQLIDYRSEIDLNQAFYKLYDLALNACFVKHSANKDLQKKAFYLSEQFKSQILKRLAKDQSTLDSVDQMKINLADLKTRAFLLAQEKYPNTEQIRDLQNEQIKIEEQLLSTYQSKSTKNLANFGYQQIQQQLKDNQTLISFHWGDRHLFVFLLQAHSFQFHQIEPIDSLLTSVERLFRWSQQRIEQQSIILQQAVYDSVIYEAHSLYQHLMAPFQDQLTQELIIAPDGPLTLVPFDLLIKKPASETRLFRNHHYFLKDHSIRYLYPASEIRYHQRQRLSNREVLTVAPTFDPSITNLQTLQFNIDEVEQVLDIIQGKSLIAQEATEHQFRTLANGYAILHLSTHGILNNLAPDFSYVAFQNQADSIENEHLFVTEIEALNLDAELVVLSACQSALGRLYRGEGLLSMARAFRIAGANSIIASLWNVDDYQTPIMMASFYESLANGTTKSEALRQAKLKYIQSASHFEAYPFYWAGFVLYGNDAPIALKKQWKWWF